MDESKQFDPDWASPPGETIADLLEERGWTQEQLAQKMEIPADQVASLLVGNQPITIELARRLERTIGGSATFWLTRESNFRRNEDHG
jgi:HTH-type transcriptional regulator / antitoxin HigA